MQVYDSTFFYHSPLHLTNEKHFYFYYINKAVSKDLLLSQYAEIILLSESDKKVI